jgi:predicted MPP superfamily phosphohydrolase
VRRALLILAVLIAATGLFATYCLLEARRDPIVRRANVDLADWPRGAPPIRVVLISDIHIGTAAMGPERLTRIVAQIDALHPDLILIAGDFIYGHDPAGAARLGARMIGPLSKLHAPLGTIAVLGNHDWWTGAAKVREQLAQAHIRTLDNAAMTVGPLALGGAGDDFSGHTNLPVTLRAVRVLPGAHVLLTHSPDIAPELPPDMPLLLAGHTHCGQVVLPFYGPISDVTQYHARYRCGIRHEGARTVIVTGGLGTSGGPFRLGAPPDLWLLTLGPAR